MNKTTMHSALAAVSLAVLAPSTLAHEGHGAPVLHLHEAEMLGLGSLAGLAVVVAAAAWFWFRGRR